MAALASQGGSGSGGLTGMAGDLLGLKNSGALFIGILRSQTAQDRLIDQFGLKHAYRVKLTMDARTKLDQNTVISEDRKSGIISIGVIDRDPQRAAAIANAYVVQLNTLVSELSTSAGASRASVSGRTLGRRETRSRRCHQSTRAVFEQEQYARHSNRRPRHARRGWGAIRAINCPPPKIRAGGSQADLRRG